MVGHSFLGRRVRCVGHFEFGDIFEKGFLRVRIHCVIIDLDTWILVPRRRICCVDHSEFGDIFEKGFLRIRIHCMIIYIFGYSFCEEEFIAMIILNSMIFSKTISSS